MAIQERVTGYSITHLRNDIVNFHQIVRLATETGHRAFIGFLSRPPAQWLTLAANTSNVFLALTDFDRIHRTLQTESPVFYTAINVIGIRAFNLGTGVEAPGEGPADDDALVPKGNRVVTIRPGRARGPLVGGNLAVLTSMAGSSYWPAFDGALLALEDVNEYIYRIDRMLSTLKLAGALDRVAGVVLGGMNRLLSATLGGFLIGYGSGLLGGALPTAQSQYLPSFLFGLVILILLVRPGGLFTRGRGPVERV